MDLLQLRYFCDAAKSQNFSKTAQRFLVPASNISQMVKRLETELGTKLFDRKANSLALNEQGKLFYEHVQQALSLLDNAKTRLMEEEELGGEIKILILTNRRIITGAIEQFKREHPKVNFVIDHNANSQNNDFDLIVSDSLMDKSWRKDFLITEDIALAAKKGSKLFEKEKLDIRDLSGERFISMQSKSSIYNLTVRLCAAAGFIPNIVIQTDDPLYMRKYIELGLGIAFIPLVAWQGQFSDEVECRKLDHVHRTSYLYRPNDRYTTKAAQAFAELLLNIYSKGIA